MLRRKWPNGRCFRPILALVVPNNHHCFRRHRRVPWKKEMDMVNTNANVVVVVNGPPALRQYYDRYYYCGCRFGENVSEKRYHAATNDIVRTVVWLSLRIIVDFSANSRKGEKKKRATLVFSTFYTRYACYSPRLFHQHGTCFYLQGK